eukprot:1197026-Pyramimonas_sp.AAC.1
MSTAVRTSRSARASQQAQPRCQAQGPMAPQSPRICARKSCRQFLHLHRERRDGAHEHVEGDGRRQSQSMCASTTPTLACEIYATVWSTTDCTLLGRSRSPSISPASQ